MKDTKHILSIVGYLFLTLFAMVGVVWIAREPIAVAVCAAAKRNISPDECIKEVAVFLSKPEMCDRVTGRDFMTEINGKTVQLQNPPKAECLTEIAARTNDVDLCAKVEGGITAETPFSCLYRVATRNKNAAACGKLEGSESRFGSVADKNSCYKMIGKTAADIPSAPPKKGPAPIFLGLGTVAYDLIAYVLLGLWGLWTVVGIVKRMKKK